MNDLDAALDYAAGVLAGFMCHHNPPCGCTRDRLSELVGLPSQGDPMETLTTSRVTVAIPGQDGVSTPVPEPGYFGDFEDPETAA